MTHIAQTLQLCIVVLITVDRMYILKSFEFSLDSGGTMKWRSKGGWGRPAWAAKFHPHLKIWNGENILRVSNFFTAGKIIRGNLFKSKKFRLSKKRPSRIHEISQNEKSRGGRQI